MFLILFASFNRLQTLNAQIRKSLDPGGDFVSRYIWRGTDFGNSPAIQPCLNWGMVDLPWEHGVHIRPIMPTFRKLIFMCLILSKKWLRLRLQIISFPDGRIENNDYS